jgi:hypothetical protein
MTAFGLLPFGTVSPWGGPGSISLITILAIGTNELLAFFTSPVKCRDPLGFRDTRNPLYWTITPVDPIHVGINGEVIVDPGKRRPSPPAPWIGECFLDVDDPTVVHLRTVPQLETGIDYDVEVGPIRGDACETFAGLSTFRVTARARPPRPTSRIAALDTYRDYANPVFVLDRSGQLVPGPGFYQFDETGEIVLDDAAGSLKKRVLRRITTALGGFVHLPRYGLPPMLGTVARDGELQVIASRLQEQILDEPDVLDASVTASVEATAAGGIVRLVVRAQQRSIGEISFLVQVPAGS